MSIIDRAAKSLRETSPRPERRDSTSPDEEVIQTSFRLPRSRWARLRQLSIEERLSVQAIVIAALEGEFERRGKKF